MVTLLAVKRGFSGMANATQLWLPVVSDGQGQLIAIADSGGQLNGTLIGPQYDAGLWNSSGLTSNSHSFNPRRWATPGGIDTISTFRSRQYDPATGKWLQEDPIGIAGGVNLYGYNGNDPNSYGDPFGTCDDPPCRSPDDPLKGRPLPPNVDPDNVTWDPKEQWYTDDETGTRYKPHKDAGHWDHWEVIPKNGKSSEYPEHNAKPWPGQKRPPYGKQSAVDPWPVIMMPPLPSTRQMIRRTLDGINWILRGLRHGYPSGLPVRPIPFPIPIPIL